MLRVYIHWWIWKQVNMKHWLHMALSCLRKAYHRVAKLQASEQDEFGVHQALEDTERGHRGSSLVLDPVAWGRGLTGRHWRQVDSGEEKYRQTLGGQQWRTHQGTPHVPVPAFIEGGTCRREWQNVSLQKLLLPFWLQFLHGTVGELLPENARLSQERQ